MRLSPRGARKSSQPFRDTSILAAAWCSVQRHLWLLAVACWALCVAALTIELIFLLKVYTQPPPMGCRWLPRRVKTSCPYVVTKVILRGNRVLA